LRAESGTRCVSVSAGSGSDAGSGFSGGFI
jgi:hypothetical protein